MKNIKIILIIILIISTIPNSFAQNIATDYNDYSNLKVDFYINGGFNLIKAGDDSKVSEAIASLTFFPQSDIRQKVEKININSEPNAQTTKGTEDVKFQWNNPEQEKFNFGVNSEININNIIIKVDEKINFPIDDASTIYTKPTDFIDITSEIREQADEIAAGEDDLYVVAFKVGYWIQQNIKYNLSTLTAEVVQKSSWVLNNKEGVCDELTNLFISMMRSIGVPARFVSGMAYTNLGNEWSPHAWAEVYFPDKGWIPFDITYSQFGWIDPTHLKLKVNKDSGDPAVRYTWKAIDTKLEGKEIDLKTKLIEKGEKINSPLNFKITPLVDKVGPGSFVPIEVKISNENNYYISDSFVVIKTPNLTEKNVKTTIIKPGETKKLFWIAKIPKEVEEDYIYFTTIEIEDQFHKSKSINITYKKDFNIVTLKEAEELIERNYMGKEIKTISDKILLTCQAQDVLIINDTAKVQCKLVNKGNTRQNNLDICYKNNCQKADLSIAEEKNLEFYINNLKLGLQTINIEASNENTRTSDIIKIEVIEDPGLKILSIEYPEKTKYNEKFNIKMTLSTRIEIKDIKLSLNDEDTTEISKLDSIQQIQISTEGKKFLDKKEIKINLEFKDKKEQTYKLEFRYPVEITDIPWYIKILNFLNLI